MTKDYKLFTNPKVLLIQCLFLVILLFAALNSCNGDTKSKIPTQKGNYQYKHGQLFTPKAPDSNKKPKVMTARDFWTLPIPAQGDPPEGFLEDEIRLTPDACGKCHKDQYKNWLSSRHSKAMSPGVTGQFLEKKASQHKFIYSCTLCHAPMTEQKEKIYNSRDEHASLVNNPHYNNKLSSKAITCTACHVRMHRRFSSVKQGKNISQGWIPPVNDNLMHGGIVRKPWFNGSAFCATCHQFSAKGLTGVTLNNKPLQNTYSEWKASSWSQKEIHCQNCHMPEKNHTWRGIHDKEMTKSAVELKVHNVRYSNHSVTARIELSNIGAGHHFPTYITPAVFITADLLDHRDSPISGSRKKSVIQRITDMSFSKEIIDTRIPSGKSHIFNYKYIIQYQPKSFKVTVEVHPDYFYLNFFKRKIKDSGSPKATKLYRQALKTKSNSSYILFTKTLAIQ